MLGRRLRLAAVVAATLPVAASLSGCGGQTSPTESPGEGAAAPTPTVSIAANPASISAGQSSTLTWSSTNASSCSASDGWGGSEPLNGSATVSPAETTIYTLTCTGAGGSASNSATVTVPPSAPRVVAVTYDTGTNPFHPCFRRPNGPSAFDAIPEIRGIAQSLKLTFAVDYATSLTQSQAAIDQMQPFSLYAIEGTNLLIYTGTNGGADLVDTYPHGSMASSQITCPAFSMAPEGFLVIANWYSNYDGAYAADSTGAHEVAPDLTRLEMWSAQQEWIDVVHLNIQQIAPTVIGTSSVASIQAMVTAGKFVVIAAGNGLGNAAGHIPTETIDYYSVPGVLVAGANDGTGYAEFSNLDPHTVMDGCATVAADYSSFGATRFDGTSSSSPRTTGYVMELLYRLRQRYGATAGTSGAVLMRLPPGQRPVGGPLADGVLTVPELHEVIRKTADPTLAASWLDGDYCGQAYAIPRPVDPQGNDYHRVGYGKLSEHTIDHALNVLTGAEPMPERPTEDRYYMLSTTARDARP